MPRRARAVTVRSTSHVGNRDPLGAAWRIGVFFSIVNIAAYAIGAPLIGRISDSPGVATNPHRCAFRCSSVPQRVHLAHSCCGSEPANDRKLHTSPDIAPTKFNYKTH